MTKTKHTPGPWRFIHDYDRKDYPIVQRGSTGGCHIMAYDINLAIADAQLIAAAPELLEALKVALDWVEDCGSQWKIPDKIYEAITKAEGGE